MARRPPQRDVAIAEVGQLVAAEEDLRAGRQVECEELCERHRNAVEHFLQRADRRAHAVLLDQRDQAVGNPRAFGELALGEAVKSAHCAQVRADVEGQGCHGVFNILHTSRVSDGSFQSV